MEEVVVLPLKFPLTTTILTESDEQLDPIPRLCLYIFCPVQWHAWSPSKQNTFLFLKRSSLRYRLLFICNHVDRYWQERDKKCNSFRLVEWFVSWFATTIYKYPRDGNVEASNSSVNLVSTYVMMAASIGLFQSSSSTKRTGHGSLSLFVAMKNQIRFGRLTYPPWWWTHECIQL